MKSTDERMRDVLGRAKAREAMRRRRRQRAVAAGGGVLGVAVVVAVGIGMSAGFGGSSGAEGFAGPSGLMGSVFSGSSALGYIAVGLLGIVLGAAVTTLAYRLGGRRGHGEEGISVQTSPGTMVSPAKPQVAKNASESLDTNSLQDGRRAP